MYVGFYEVPWWWLVVAGGVFSFLLAGFVWWWRGRSSMGEGVSGVLLAIEVPRENDKTPVAAEHLYQSLHGLLRADNTPDVISFEIQALKGYIRFFVYCPTVLEQYVSKQLYAQYPDVKISKVEDFVRTEVLEANGGCLGATVQLAQPWPLPIKTFANFDVDPLSAVTSSMSGYDEGEEMWLQMILTPAELGWSHKAMEAAKAISQGKSIGGFYGSGNFLVWVLLSFFKFIFISLPKAFFMAGNSSSDSVDVGQTKVVLSEYDKERIGLIEQKSRKVGFQVTMRAVVNSSFRGRSAHMLNELMASLQQYSLPQANSLEFGRPVKNLKSFINQYQRRVASRRAAVMNSEEIASIFHLPSQSVETPGIVWAKSRKGEPPPNLPLALMGDNEDLTVFAKTDFRYEERKFGIKQIDRLRHIYVIGKTGMGKSTLLSNMAIDDVRSGRGVAVIDPHGDLIDDVLECIPRRRINDVVIFSPADREFPVGFNMLEKVDSSHMPLVASGLIAVFYKMFSHSWGPRMEHILRNIILALLEMPNATLMGITRIIVDKKYREKVIDNVRNPAVHDFWKKEFPALASGNPSDTFGPIQNKVGQFLSTSIVRNIVGQEHGTINIRKIMDEKKIFLVNLSKGKIGEDVSALFGSMLITKIQLAAMSRADIPESQRVPFYLYVDEFQNFATESFATILSEARKYKLGLTMANQYIAQMPEEVRNAVFGNVGSLISFGVGASDAGYLVKEFNPVFNEDDLISLDKRHIYLKMAIDGVSSVPFSATTLPPPANRSNNVEKIVGVSRERYAMPAEEIEEYIQTWSGMKARLAQRQREEELKIKEQERKQKANEDKQKQGSQNNQKGSSNRK